MDIFSRHLRDDPSNREQNSTGPRAEYDRKTRRRISSSRDLLSTNPVDEAAAIGLRETCYF